MNYRLDWSIQDRKPGADTGRIIVYGAGTIRGKGIRFYWKPAQKGLITISPVRKIDEDRACSHVELFDKLIDMEFGKY